MILFVPVLLSSGAAVGVEGEEDDELAEDEVVEFEEGALQERLRGEMRVLRRRERSRDEGTALRLIPSFFSPNNTCHIDLLLPKPCEVCRSGT